MEGQDKDPRRDDEDEDDDQDRKPPAREVLFTKQSPTASSPGDMSGENSLASTVVASMPQVDTDASNSKIMTMTPRLVAATPGEKTPQTKTQMIKTPTSSSSYSRRSWLQEDILLLSGTSLLSIMTFLYVVLPLTALMSLAVFMASSSALSYALYQYALQEFERLLQGRGLGEYLPESLYRTLAEQSLHENLIDPSFTLEYRHLMLYFLPISAAQRDAFIERLAPHHRDTLYRPGLGNLLGPGFMRVLMGEQRQQLAAATTTTTTTPSTEIVVSPAAEIQMQMQESLVPTTPRRRLYDGDSEDSNSDLGLDVDESDLAGGLDVQQATAMARYLGIGGGGNSSSEVIVTNEAAVVVVPASAPRNDETAATPDELDRQLQEEYAAEEVVLNDAYSSAFNESMWLPMVQYVTDTAAQVIPSVTRPLLGGSIGITLLSGGIGIWGYWNGVYSRPSFSTPRVQLPSSGTMWTTALLGGASAGLILFGRSYLYPYITTSTSKPATESSPDDDKKKQK